MSRRKAVAAAGWAASLVALVALAILGHTDLALHVAPVALFIGLPMSGRFVGSEHLVRRLRRERTRHGRPVSAPRPVEVQRVLRSILLAGSRPLRGPPSLGVPAG